MKKRTKVLIITNIIILAIAIVIACIILLGDRSQKEGGDVTRSDVSENSSIAKNDSSEVVKQEEETIREAEVTGTEEAGNDEISGGAGTKAGSDEISSGAGTEAGSNEISNGEAGTEAEGSEIVDGGEEREEAESTEGESKEAEEKAVTEIAEAESAETESTEKEEKAETESTEAEGTEAENEEAGGDETVSDSSYEAYSNTKVGWCFKRNKNHVPSGTYEPFDIDPYNAFYLDEKAANEGEKVVYFAFDCGYEYGYTPKILDVLKEKNVKGVFFVTKAFIDTSSDLCIRMKEEGHIVGNHTMYHPSLPAESMEELKAEVEGLEDYFLQKTGYELDKYIRPPMGEYSERVLAYLKDTGYTTIFWSLAYNDYDVNNQPGEDYVIEHFKNYYHDGMITLTHTVSKSNTEALDDIIDMLSEEGYRFGTVDELE